MSRYATDLIIQRTASEFILSFFETIPPMPLHILAERDDDGSFIVSDDTFAVYGTGDTQSQARQDYIVSLVEYYELVSDHAKDDDPRTRSLLKRLQHYIQKAN